MLLEVVCAVFLLAVGIFAIMQSLNRCIAATASIRQYAVVGALLANKSYELRTEMADDYDDLNEDFPDMPGYRWERVFEEMEDTQETKMWIQHLTVYWIEQGREVSESITEYRYLPEKPY